MNNKHPPADEGQPTPQQPNPAMLPHMLAAAATFFMGGMGNQQQLNLDSQCIDNVLPARVRAAFQFAAFMGHRTAPIVAANDMSIEFCAPTDLTTSEDAAWHAACNTLEAYFLGKLSEDRLEEKRNEANAIELFKRRPGKLVVCFQCDGVKQKQNKECEVCEGSGKVLLIPGKHSRPFLSGEGGQ